MNPTKIFKDSLVTKFLDEASHPLRAEIEALRTLALSSTPGLEESIKWNGPNYSIGGEDRITMRIHPPKQIQLILHRGAKKRAQPATRLIEDASGLLAWKENDRAVISLKTMAEIDAAASSLIAIFAKWIAAAV